MKLIKSLGLAKILCCLLLANSSSAFAFWMEGELNVGIFGGYSNSQAKGMQTFDPTSPTIVADTKNVSYQPIAGITLGLDWRKCNSPFSMELMYAYLGEQKYKLTNTYPVGPLVDFERISVKSNALLLNGYFDWGSVCNFQPFLGGGLGVSRSKVGATFVNQTPPDMSGRWDKKYNTRFAYDLMIGLSYAFCENMEVFLAYQYLFLGKIKSADRVVDNLGNVYITPITIQQIDANNLLVTLKYKF